MAKEEPTERSAAHAGPSTEAVLRESQRTLATLMSNLPGIAYRCHNDPQWTMEFISDGCLELTGYPPAALTNNRDLAYADLVHPDDRRLIWDAVQAGVRQRRPFRLLYRIRSAAGAEKWVWEQGQGVFAESGELLALEGFITDITDRKRIENELLQSEQRFRVLADASFEGIVIHDAGVLLDANRRMYELFGYSRDELAGRQIIDLLLTPDSADLVRCRLGEPASEPYEVVGVRKDGTRIPLELQGRNLEFQGRQVRVAVVKDLTAHHQAEAERAALQAQLIQSQKLEAIGQLAGGVAHDFNNVLTAILGSAELLREHVSDEPAAAALDTLEKAVQHATGITRALLTFSRRLPAEKRLVDLAQVVHDSARFLRRLLPATIELQIDVPPDRPLWVHADATQLNQVVLNLAINARDAMPHGGALRIAAAAETPPDGAADNGDGVTISGARLTVGDTGGGIPPEVRPHIFEPFYTTKNGGQGAGLGLALVRSIVQAHAGRIEVQSQLGRGATFVITLPGARPGERADAEPERTPAPRARGELVLVAEDDEPVRELIRAALELLGYTVLLAVDGPGILQRWHTHGRKVGLLVLDIDLPKRSALDCLRELRAGEARVPTILITGAEHDLSEGLGPDTVLLRKPFGMFQLGRLAHEMLHATTHWPAPV